MKLITILKWIKGHKNIFLNAVLSLCVAISVISGITLRRQNKKLSESLKMALNNIEFYQTSSIDNHCENNVLKLDILSLSQLNDKLILKLDSVRAINKIKPKNIHTAAVLTQTIYIHDTKEVKGDIVEILKDTVYTDTLQYNNLTKVFYSIGKDSVDIGLDIKNSLYLYIYKHREYKNKKNFFKRLFTLDFKKVDSYKYKIINTNDIIKEDSIRIIEQEDI